MMTHIKNWVALLLGLVIVVFGYGTFMVVFTFIQNNFTSQEPLFDIGIVVVFIFSCVLLWKSPRIREGFMNWL